MAYSTNILPRYAAYYSLNNASISSGELTINSGGSAEIQISSQMLPKLTARMLVVVHPSKFSSSYTNDAIQVTLSIVTTSGARIEYLIPVTYSASGVFNTVIDLPEETFASFIYKISSKADVSVYNWELCAEEAVDVTTVIDGVEQSLPKLLYDYNTYAYAVAQREVTVGLISCYLLDATDLQGHFTLSFFATERCNVHIRIKDNGATELYTPVVYTVEKGYNSVSVPHAYLKKLATDHAFAVTLQCTNGQLSIPVRGMLYTIDGGYLATRLLDAGVGVEDIAIKQLPGEDSPSEIWSIGFEGNRLLLKSREYSQAVREEWTAIKDFGEGLHAGVEFAGSWTYRNGSDTFTIETESTPHVLIVGTDGVLTDYYGDTFTESVTLDTNVSGISVCLGYNSLTDESYTHGMIVAYVKNGNVYYRQWMLDTDLGEYRWHGAMTLYQSGDASFVSVHRLPDYRVGICVRHGSSTTWYITHRNYVSQGIKPEVVDAYVDETMITSVYAVDQAPSEVYVAAKQNTFEVAPAYNGFTMTFNGPVEFIRGRTIDALKESMTVSINGTIVDDTISSITIDGGIVTVTLKEDVLAGRTVLIKYNCPYITSVSYNGCYTNILQEYSWDLPRPIYELSSSESIPVNVSATLKVSVGEIITSPLGTTEQIQTAVTANLDAVVHPILTNNLTAAEAVNADVTADLSIAVSQVGTTPV